LPDNFGDSSASRRINNVDNLEDVASLCWSYSEASEDEDDDDKASALIMEELEDESDSLDHASTTDLNTITTEENSEVDEQDEVANSPPLLFIESTQVLLNEEVIEGDGGSTTSDELEPRTSSMNAPLLGTIWVKHPKHGCMVRRSLRLLMLSRLG
jgi:hypothetical protein